MRNSDCVEFSKSLINTNNRQNKVIFLNTENRKRKHKLDVATGFISSQQIQLIDLSN